MTPEEFQRIKEAEKAHLRSLQALKSQLRDLERKQSTARALEDIARAPGDDVLNTHEEMIEKLAIETARNEARLEIAREAAAAPETTEPPLYKVEAEMEKMRARELVRQVKLQMGLSEKEPKQEPSKKVAQENEPRKPSSEAGDDSNPPPPPDSLPDKTIGRIR